MKILQGDCLEVMKTLPDNSIDTIITDPPYGLSFMGKKWDYDVPKVEIWQECLRVLKPGGTALIFAGSRTQHRMAVNVEDAGFELKDTIMWLYGSGFPKATDISKQIDKIGGKATGWFGKWLKDWRKRNNIAQREVSKLFPSKTGGLTGCVANWELGLNMPTAEQFTKIVEYFKLPFDTLVKAEREIVGKQKTNLTVMQNIGSDNISGEVDITKAKTPEAKLWNGWKSHGLKPAYEPILVAVKPNEGTYANNALKWGVSGLNIESARIKPQNKKDLKEIRSERTSKTKGNDYTLHKDLSGMDRSNRQEVTGRFPANIILDEEAGKMLDEQSGESKSVAITAIKGGSPCHKGGFKTDTIGTWHGDKGGASRFFYCAKASKSERNAGCEELFMIKEKVSEDDIKEIKTIIWGE